MGNETTQAMSVIITLVVQSTLAWAAFRVYRRAGFPGAWFVGPACFFVPVVGVLSMLVHMATADWPALASERTDRRA